MKVTMTLPAEFQIRTLTDARRAPVLELIEKLKNWENDLKIRKRARKLPNRDTYVVVASNGMHIFFTMADDIIQIVDIASKETIELFTNAE